MGLEILLGLRMNLIGPRNAKELLVNVLNLPVSTHYLFTVSSFAVGKDASQPGLAYLLVAPPVGQLKKSPLSAPPSEAS